MTLPPLPQFQLSPEIPWTVRLEFNLAIDFCVWFLEQAESQFLPLQQNTLPKHSYQLPGLTPEIWQHWFEIVVRLQDANLYWNSFQETESAWIERQLKPMQQMARNLTLHHPHLAQIDWQTIQSSLRQQYNTYQSRFEQSITLVPQFGNHLTLYRDRPDAVFAKLMFQHDDLVQRVAQAWQIYDAEIGEHRMQCSNLEQPGRIIQREDPFPSASGLTHLNLYLVAAESFVEYFVTPHSVVLYHPTLQADDAALVEVVNWVVPKLEEKIGAASTQHQFTR